MKYSVGPIVRRAVESGATQQVVGVDARKDGALACSPGSS